MERSLNVQSLFNTLQLDLNDLDAERLQHRKQVLTLCFLFIPLIAAMIVAIFVFVSKDSMALFYVFFFGDFILLAVFLWKVEKVRKEFAASFKSKLIHKIIKKIDSSFDYAPEKRTLTVKSHDPMVNHIHSVKLFPSFDRLWLEDVISGSVQDHSFQFGELKMEYGTGRNRKTVFTGIVLKVNVGKRFESPVYVLPDSANRLRDSLYKMLHQRSDRGEVVELSHAEFEKLFKVYAANPTFVSSILTDKVLDKLVAMHEKITALNKTRDSVRIAFVDNSITVTVALRTNLFEPRLFKPVNDIAFIEANVNYLLLFLGLIEDLRV